jgi:hypothetical protein
MISTNNSLVEIIVKKRRGWESNPRSRFTRDNCLAGSPVRPLQHLSITAEEGTRTPTSNSPQAPQACVSTNSTTSACSQQIIHLSETGSLAKTKNRSISGKLFRLLLGRNASGIQRLRGLGFGRRLLRAQDRTGFTFMGRHNLQQQRSHHE